MARPARFERTTYALKKLVDAGKSNNFMTYSVKKTVCNVVCDDDGSLTIDSIARI